MKYSIHKLDESLLHYLPHKQQPFDVIGRIVPVYDGNIWILKEELLDTPYQRTYPNEIYDAQTYIDDEEQAFRVGGITRV